MNVILASTSPRRTALLTLAGIQHRVLAPHCDELVSQDMTPSNIVQVLAKRKADAVLDQVDDGLIVGADTIVVCDGEVFGKPADAHDALRMLRRLQGRWHDVYSGVCVLDAAREAHRIGYERIRVRMRSLLDPEMIAYVQTMDPLDKAGAYSIQGIGALFVQELHGDYYGVVGLPLVMTVRFLVDLGLTHPLLLQSDKDWASDGRDF